MRPEEHRKRTKQAKKCSYDKINKRIPHHRSSTHQRIAIHSSSQFPHDRPTFRNPKYTENVGTSDNGVRWGKDQRQRKGSTKTKENPHNA
ncbi:hypothetical protein Pmani_010759 [Petrolisthes manimaculis]|uniref:Uncharacterized protein n=1 Tax=Petrolisthes manimaculis TaxID=1843537 RepID=A0AAE1Q4C9_9EUCA|nr:hypothetical protein Pmani_010759 [Petrolisthes manimaculis]